MKSINILILSFLIFFYFLPAFSQDISNLKKKKEENLNAIELASELLKETKKEKSVTLNNLYLIENKIHSRNSLIENISLELKIYSKMQDSILLNIKILENELEKLKITYARTLEQAYKIRHNRSDIVMFILSSKNFNQAYKRMKYFQQILNYESTQHENILQTRKLLITESLKIDSIINFKTQLLAEKTSESNKLISEKKSRDQLLKSLKNKENELKLELQRRKKNLRLLEKSITKYIESEAERDEKNKLVFSLTPDEKLISESFEKNRGILPWPTDKGIISGKYGEQKHKTFKYVTINNKGIDITTPPKSYARCIFNGEVKNIATIPGFHKVVIVRHGEYLSLYGNLSVVNVKVGDVLSTKQNIGIIYQEPSDNYSILHFEIWKESENMNPNYWIKN